MRGATMYRQATLPRNRISTHTPHAGRDVKYLLFLPKTLISTHTPHAGRDLLACVAEFWTTYFYSHAPCGARPFFSFQNILVRQFLLTRPMRGATSTSSWVKGASYISTHTPHAGRDDGLLEWVTNCSISTHTPHAGRDLCSKSMQFFLRISTHTPHAGRDGNISNLDS